MIWNDRKQTIFDCYGFRKSKMWPDLVPDCGWVELASSSRSSLSFIKLTTISEHLFEPPLVAHLRYDA